MRKRKQRGEANKVYDNHAELGAMHVHSTKKICLPYEGDVVFSNDREPVELWRHEMELLKCLDFFWKDHEENYLNGELRDLFNSLYPLIMIVIAGAHSVKLDTELEWAEKRGDHLYFFDVKDFHDIKEKTGKSLGERILGEK